MTPPPDLERLKMLLGQCTPGDWYPHHDREAGPGWGYFITAEPLGHMANEIAREVSSESNAALIALTPTLAAQVLALAEENERLRAALDMYGKHARSCDIGAFNGRCTRWYSATLGGKQP